MTPPTEKPFEPTPEQVEEAGRMLSGLSNHYWSILDCHLKEPWIYAAKRHLADLSTLRSQLDALKDEVVAGRALLRAFGRHNDWCDCIVNSDSIKCDCGLVKALTPAAMEAKS